MTVMAMGGAVMAQDGPQSFAFVVGPRIGVSYMFMSQEEFSERIQARYPDGEYVPLTTLFGITFEQRIVLGNTESHFAFQQLVMVGAIEQSIALPSAAFLVGYRDLSGFEIGAGPSLSVGGLGVIAAIGWTISANGVFVPVDVSVLLPNQQRPTSVSVTTGFNFVSRRAKPRR
jgi:hypothetical protein